MFFLVGAFIASSNAWNAVRATRPQPKGAEKVPAPLPLVGGLLMVLGMLSAPSHTLQTFAWIPLFLDYGCLPTVGKGIAHSLFGKTRRGELATLSVDSSHHQSKIDGPVETATSKSTLPNGQFEGDGAGTPR